MYRSYSALCFSVSVKYNAVQELDLNKVIMSPSSRSMSRSSEAWLANELSQIFWWIVHKSFNELILTINSLLSENNNLNFRLLIAQHYWFSSEYL